MMLSSTIRTLIGGTAPSMRLAGSLEPALAVFLDFLGPLPGWGEATRSGAVEWSTIGWPLGGI